MTPTFKRLSSAATITEHEKAFAIDAAVIEAKSIDATNNPRKREILVLHRGASDTLQRMVNALQPATYIRPHRHHAPPKAEALVLLSGSLGFVPFLGDGTPDDEGFVLLHRSKGALAVDCRESVWHTFFALEPNTAIFEVKAGPFDANTDKEFAPWAPAEEDHKAPSYLASLERRFRTRFGGRGILGTDSEF